MPVPVVVSYGLIRVGEHWNKDLVSLAYDAAYKALDGSGFSEVDSIFVGNMLGDALHLQGNLGAYIADELGVPGIPAVRVEAGGASGSYAIAEAAYSIASGRYDVVLAGGVEKMSDALPSDVFQVTNLGEDMYIMNFTGLTTAGLNAIVMRMYMDRYGVDKEKITSLAVLDHSNAVYASHAQFRSPINLDLAMSSPILADPMNIFDSYAVGDGAAFVAVTSKKFAEGKGLDYVEIAGIGISSNLFSISERPDPLWFDGTERAISRALEVSGVGYDDIDLVEIHDEYTITGVLSLESLGFSERGEGAEDVWSRKFSREGVLPINTFGGLKARGNPLGATGAYQVAEVFMQLSGLAGENSVDGAKVGLVHNMGGLDNISVVLVLKRGGVSD